MEIIISKTNIIRIGYLVILLLLLINRWNTYSSREKIEGIFISWERESGVAGFEELLHLADNDTTFAYNLMLKHMSYYAVAYKEDGKIISQDLEYMLNLKNGEHVILLRNPDKKEDIIPYSFLSFWLVPIILSIVGCGAWLLIFNIFFEKTKTFAFSLGKKKQTDKTNKID